jgi:hypothetical protein
MPIGIVTDRDMVLGVSTGWTAIDRNLVVLHLPFHR